MNEIIKDILKEKRPSLGDSSLNTYTSILKNLYKKVFNEDSFDINDFEKTDVILDHLKLIPSNKRKTILSALVVLTDRPEYRELMLEDINDYNKDILKQENKKDWLSEEEITNMINNLKKESSHIYKKSSPSIADLQTLQNYIIICLLGGKYIPPRRSKDYVDFKIKNIDTDKDNYLLNNSFVFNSYKTSKTYGTQIIEIPKELKAIVKKWIKINPTEYLLFDSKQNQLSNVKLNQRLNKLFKKHSSVNALRHTYLTEKYGHSIDERSELSKDMTMMGSSTHQEKLYIKKGF